MKVIVIIPAAGLGTRMASSSATAQGKAPSKQFLTIADAPILVHTLRKFVDCKEVDEIYIALRPQEAESFISDLPDFGIDPKRIRIAEGGEHRQQSVANTCKSAKGEADDVVLVHDAVRPFVDHATIVAVIEGVKK